LIGFKRTASGSLESGDGFVEVRLRLQLAGASRQKVRLSLQDQKDCGSAGAKLPLLALVLLL
jgi:hypothetical protein